MHFKIKITSGGEVRWADHPDAGPIYYGGPPPESGCWKLDMVRLEDYIDKQLDDAWFGGSIETFVLGFEIGDLEGWGPFFTSMCNYTSYRPKMRLLISVGQINWPDVKDLDKQAQFDCFCGALMAAVARVGKMKRKPKGFDADRLLNKLELILAAFPVSEVKPSGL